MTCNDELVSTVTREAQTYTHPRLKGFSGVEGPSHVRVKSSFHFDLRSAKVFCGMTAARLSNNILGSDLALTNLQRTNHSFQMTQCQQ